MICDGSRRLKSITALASKVVMENDIFIFTEAIGCELIGAEAVKSFHRFHNRKIHVFIKEGEIGKFVPHENTIFHVIKPDSPIIEHYKSGHLGTAVLWVNIMQENPGKRFIHFDSDVIFRGNMVDDIVTSLMSGADLVGPRRAYAMNCNKRDDVRNLPDVVQTYCFGFNSAKITTTDINVLVNHFRGYPIERKHPVIDFFDPISFEILDNGGRIEFIDENIIGGVNKKGLRLNKFPIINSFIDAGEKIAHFSSVGSGLAFYEKMTRGEPINVPQSYVSHSLFTYDMYQRVVFNRHFLETSKFLPYIDHIKTYLFQSAEGTKSLPTDRSGLRVAYTGMWYGFQPPSYLIQRLLRAYGPITNVNNVNECDLCVAGVWTPEPVKNRYNIQLAGESYYLKSDDGVFDATLASDYTHDRVICLPYFMQFLYWDNPERFITKLRNRPVITKETIPKKFCCFIVSNPKCEMRNLMFQFLNKAKPVDSWGKYKNNMGTVLAHGHTTDEFRALLSEYKFVIAFENSKNDVYITEKLVNPLMAGVIPIYWGTDAVFDIFNKESILYLDERRPAAMKELINRILEIDANDDEYLRIVNQPAFVNYNEFLYKYGIDRVAANLTATLGWKRPTGLNIRYINLDHRDDRFRQMKSQFDLIPGSKTVRRVSAIKHSNGAIECTMSHAKALREARDEGVDHVLIMEDDFMFINPSRDPYRLQKLLGIMDMRFSHQNWDVLLVSTVVNEKSDEVLYNEDGIKIQQVINAQTCTGYIVNAHYFDVLIDQFETGYNSMLAGGDIGTFTSDQVWKSLQKRDKWYVALPILAKQHPSHSDIDN